MRYINEKCTCCGKAFTENDEVVVCPECATPHHRECYNETGRCVNEHLHGEGFVWKKSEPMKKEAEKPQITTEKEIVSEEKDFSVCPDCGAENKKRAIVCTNCGAVLIPEFEEEVAEKTERHSIYIQGLPVNDNDYVDAENTVTVKEAACFIQRNKESYIKTFLDAKVNNRKPKFNFAAFVFGPYWFFFRKIYKAGFAFAGVIFAINCFVMSFFMSVCGEALSFVAANAEAFMQSTVDEALMAQYIELVTKGMETHSTEILLMFAFEVLILLVNVVAGIFANKIYLGHIRKTISKIKEVVPQPAAHFTYIYAKGGTTILNTFLIGMAIYYLTEFIFSQALL